MSRSSTPPATTTSLPDATRALAVAGTHCRVAGAHDLVQKTECVYTFHSPYTSPFGIVVNLQTFAGTTQEHAFGHNNKNDANTNEEQEGLFVRIVQQRVAKAPASDSNDQEAAAAAPAPTKLGIGVEGGFASEQDKYETLSTHSLVHLKQQQPNGQVVVVAEVACEESTKNDVFPMVLVESIDSILKHAGASLQQDVQVWQMDQDDVPVSKYANDALPFVDNGVTISPHPADWKCQKSGVADGNVWLNLSDGYMGGGRQQWDGSGGSNGALDHYQATNQQYPLVVKLGTITSDIDTADCYSYAADEDGPVKVPNLAALLAKRGIHVANLQKTVKSTAELTVELNANYAFDAITESDAKLQPVSGPALQGLQNLGNSCYLNSVVQLLFHLPEWAQRYGGGKAADDSETTFVPRNVSPTQAPEHVLVQTHKLGHALVSGDFGRPILGDTAEENEALSTDPKYRVAPRMFKHVIGKDHVDFKTGQQQDAPQFLQYFLELLDRAEQKQFALATQKKEEERFYPSSHWLSFALETRSVCTADQKVKYSASEAASRETIWSLPIPMELATTPPQVAAEGGPPDYKRHKTTPAGAAASSDAGSAGTDTTTSTTADDDEGPTPQIQLTSCLEQWAAETVVEDMVWPHLSNAKHAALRTTRLTNFPPYLVMQLQRYTLGPDWQPVKLQVELQLPTTEETATKQPRYVVDLAKYKSAGGPQPNEVLVPAEDEAAAAPAPAAAAPVIDEAALAQLMDMGFSLNSCKRALTAVGGNNVEAAMGWVFEHNTDADFNDPLPEAGTSGAAAAAATTSDAGVDEAAVQSLVEMLGCFTADQVRFGLKQTNGASDRAADWLFSHMEELDALMVEAASATAADDSTAAAPAGTLELPPLQDSSSSCSTYQLTGLISHIGKHTGSGHYVAHLWVNGKWIIFNDEKVAESTKPPVEHAYLYLWTRTDVLNAEKSQEQH